MCTDAIFVHPIKIEAVIGWEQPKSVTKGQTFLGLEGYYHRFLEGLSKITTSWT